MAADEYRFRAMASEVQVIIVDGPTEAGNVAQRAVDQLELSWSRFVDTSDISRLNNGHGQGVQVAPATVTLLKKMGQAWTMTGGLFDPSVLRSVIAAGYSASIDDSTAQTVLPTPATTSQVNCPSFELVTIDHTQLVTVPAGMAIDAGGLGKGLAADLVVAELLARGTAGALVSIGGDVAAAGQPPEQGGWRLDIENPVDPARNLAQITFSGGGVATSSTRTRRWVYDNREQHHVIDPRTGQPSQTDLVAATVVAACGWQAEAHATAVLLGGQDRFDDYTATQGVEAVATTVAGATIATNGLADLVFEPVMTS